MIDTERGQALADEYGIKFMETSAKNSINVDKVRCNAVKLTIFLSVLRVNSVGIHYLGQGHQKASDRQQ